MAPPTQPANGLLPLPAAILRKKEAKDSPPANAPAGPGPASRKAAGPRLKVVIRRLPPGLTQPEFEAALGEDWKFGAGRVNWINYQTGKISKDASKPSRPARAYLHLTDQIHLKTLSEKVQQCDFVDGKNTTRDSVLIGPPALEFAPYTRVPLGRKKNDPRQGTIDQDPEFIDFLQSLTNPVSKPAYLDTEPSLNKKQEITTTPLIEHLREKKAAKERAGAKGGKQGKGEGKESKADKANKKGGKGTTDVQEKGKKASKTEKGTKEAVKVLNREASNTTGSGTGATAEKKAQSSVNGTPGSKSERPARTVSVAARIQQDLGLAPGGRRGKRDTGADNQTAPVSTPSPETVSTAANPSAASPKKTPRARPKKKTETGADGSRPTTSGSVQPTILKKSAEVSQPSNESNDIQAAAPKGPKSRTPAAEAALTNTASTILMDTPRQAFLKHANPSQGITESLIEEALKVFGAIEKVEIDRKKGFAYVDFADNEGLKKAIEASPIKVAQGAVQVLEKRDKNVARAPPVTPRGGFRGGRGGRGRGGGRGGAAVGGAGAASSTANATGPSAPVPESGGSAT